MTHNEFEIGGKFRCGQGLWRVTDVGTRVAVAIRIDRVTVQSTAARRGRSVPVGVGPAPGDRVKIEWTREPDRVPNQAEAVADGWFDGPPYAVAEQVFDENDMKSCTPASIPSAFAPEGAAAAPQAP